MDSISLNALVKKRKSDLAAMPRPPPIKRIKRPSTVLDEDTYVDSLSRIITRDFFPGLAANEAKREFLDALDSHDDAWIYETSSRLNLILDGNYTPGRRGVTFQSSRQVTPKGFIGDTPAKQSIVADQESKMPMPNLNLSLGAFQAKYTSEDNESFSALVDKQNQKNREKHAYLFTGNKIPTARQIAWREREARLLEAAESSMDLALYRRDTRPAGPEVKFSAPRNAFMFMPESVEDTLTTVAQDAENKSNAPPKTILYDNTRLTDDGLSRPTAVPGSPSLSAIKDALAGRPHLNSSEAGWETPRVAGYAFVDAEPTEAELRVKNSQSKATAMATLSRITKDAKSSSGQFILPETRDREKLHHKLVDKANESHRNGPLHSRIAELGITPGRTATPKFHSAPKKKGGHLTPAAQVLYSKVHQLRTTKTAKSSIVDFDLTPLQQRKGKKNLFPGLTPRQGLRRED